MPKLTERLPKHAWAATGLLAVIAGAVFFVPVSVGTALGLSFEQFFLAMGAIELTSAIGIGAIVVHYRTTETEESESEWRFDP
ncbi:MULTISPECIES: hypothetical protein [Salinibaculum]|uniref:hypothetical protein n=1 Tax=Salinibaculum TaxID=2732368 RepID=UPI0030D53661